MASCDRGNKKVSLSPSFCVMSAQRCSCEGCVLPRPWPWVKAHRLCCSGVCSFFLKPEEPHRMVRGGRVKNISAHQPPHWNLSPALEVQKGVRMKILHIPESSIAEIQRGQNRTEWRFVWPVLCRHYAAVSGHQTLDVSQGAYLSFPDSFLQCCFPSPGYLSFPVPCQFYVPPFPIPHTEIFLKPWIWSWVPPTLKSSVVLIVVWIHTLSLLPMSR